MASDYERMLKALLESKKSLLEGLLAKGAETEEIRKVQAEVALLEQQLVGYSSGLDHFRKRQLSPSTVSEKGSSAH